MWYLSFFFYGGSVFHSIDCFPGAGISVAAGIPDFRSNKSIPGFPDMKKKLTEIFQTYMLSVGVIICRKCAALLIISSTLG